MSELGLKEAARLAEVSRDTIRRAIQRGELPALLVTGTTGPQFKIQEDELKAWNQKRARAYPHWQEDEQDPQTDVSALSLRLVNLENSHREQSSALVQLAVQQNLFQSVQKWKNRASISKSKIIKLDQKISHLEEENLRQKQLWDAEKDQLIREIRTHRERVNWLEKRVPRWVRGLFGAQ